MADTILSQLVINKLTKQQYKDALAAGTISDDEFYSYLDEDGSVTPAEAQAMADSAETNAKEYADTKATAQKFSFTIPASGFGTAPCSQTISVPGILATDVPTIGLVLSDTVDTARTQKEEAGKISRIKTQNGSVVVWCFDDVPTVDLTVQAKVVR